MLKWENFVIQHEKMQKLREDIAEGFKTGQNKLSVMSNKHRQLKEKFTFFSKVLHIIDLC